MSYEVLIGLRHLKGRNRSKSVSVLTMISILGVVVGVWALIVVLSVLSGFGQDLRKKIVESTPNMEVDRYHGELVKPTSLCTKIKRVPDVKSCSAFVTNEMMLSSATNMSGVLLRGIESSAARIKSLTKQMKSGKFSYLFAPHLIPKPPKVTSIKSYQTGNDPFLAPFPTPSPQPPLRLLVPKERQPDARRAVPEDPFALPPELDPDRQKRPATSRPTRPKSPRLRHKTPDPLMPAPIIPRQRSAFAPASRPTSKRTTPRPKARADKAPDTTQATPKSSATDTSDGEFALPFGQAAKATPKPKEKQYPGILLGQELAQNLGVSVGEVVRAVSPLGGSLTPMGPAPRVLRYRVAGVFYTGMYEYDTKFAFVTLKSAQTLFKMEGIVSGLELGLRDIYVSGQVKNMVRKTLGGGPYRVRDWIEMNSQLFGALQMEKIAMFLILGLIVLVASFNIVSTLTMVVLEKAEEIAILKSMGATRSSIMRIFMIEGVAIGVVGTVIGLFLGWRSCIFLLNHPFQMNQDVYYITHLPVQMSGQDFFAVAIAALVISFMATIYPALQAARLHPVEGLQHE